MKKQTSQAPLSPLDDPAVIAFIEEKLGEGLTNAGIVRALNIEWGVTTSRRSILRFIERHDLESIYQRKKDQPYENQKPWTEGINMEKGHIELVTPPTEDKEIGDADRMLEERGLDPAEWKVESASLNEWDGNGGRKMQQAKFHFKRNIGSTILPARSDGWKAPNKEPIAEGADKLVVVVSDHQAPFHDKSLHGAFLSWLRDNEPEEGIINGDLMDYPKISRHKLDPKNTAEVNECNQAAYDILRDYVEASPNTRWRFQPGNHDIRLESILVNNPDTAQLVDMERARVRPFDQPEMVMTLERLLTHVLRLDELGIEYVDPHGSWELGEIKIAPKLATRHGWITRKGSGMSSLATVDHLRYSVITSHTHRLSIVHKTTHDPDGGVSVLVAAESGCMCRVSQNVIEGRRFPGFAVNPDWQQGFVTASVHGNGLFKLDTAVFVDGNLLWRDERYGL